MFVAVGDSSITNNNVATSTDAMTWYGNGLVTTGNAKYVACDENDSMIIVANDTEVFYSTNQGVNWTSLSTLFSSGTLFKLSYKNDRFIAVGTSSTSAVRYSFDGIIWYSEFNFDIFPTSFSSSCIYKSSVGVVSQAILDDENLTISSEVRQEGFINFSLTNY